MHRPVLVANWKMHHGPSAAREFVARFIELHPARSNRTVVLCPPAISVEAVRDALAARSDVELGVQNIWTEPGGAFTGETSGAMAADAGARFALVGHSERRRIFGETSELAGAKCAAAAAAGLIPILCVGESLEEREGDRTISVVLEQLSAGLESVGDEVVAGMCVAYEPVWAIGTGRNATPEDASAVHVRIRSALRERLGDRGAEPPILYGGSVNAANAAALLGAPEVGGLLVGGASLDPATWASICAT
jgi:triosephosphate isomerase